MTIDPDLLDAVAGHFVDLGRIAPALAPDADGRFRSWWWPLPTAADRAVLAPLIGPDNDLAAHRNAAEALAEAVDARVRERLEGRGGDLIPRLPGRRALPEHWLRSLTATDPYLADSIDETKAQALADELDEWVRSALRGIGRTTIHLRIVEPASNRSPWHVEPLVVDLDESSLVVPLATALAPQSPFPPTEAETILAALGHTVRLAPELAPMLDDSGTVALTDAQITALLTDHIGPLAEVGVTVLVPSWWTNRRPLGVRAKAQSTGSESAGAFGFDDLVSFTWEAALGDQRLTKADIATLQRAVTAKRELVRVRGQWVLIRPDEVAAMLRAHGTAGETTVGALVRTGLGIAPIDAPDGAPVTGATAAGQLGELLDGSLQRDITAIDTPDGFNGTLRPYQSRGATWLRLLGRLGLGACLADDMGLGKTAQLIATILVDPVDEPTLVVCPTSVLGNWQAELDRFAPALDVLVHHGTARATAAETFDSERDGHDVVVTSYGVLARDIATIGARPWGRLVLDEAQQVKNPYTTQSKAVQQVTASRRIALTGTPVENRLAELWAIMSAVNPGLLGSLNSFRERFAIPIERNGDDEAAERLQRATAPFILRRLKTDRTIIDDLPDKVEITDRCQLTREQATLYQAVVDDLLTRTADADGQSRRGLVLAGVMKLKQVCNHPTHFLGDRSALHDRSGKLTRTEELLDELLAAGDKALCFTQFREWGDLVVPYLARRFGVPVLWLHGGTTRKQRDAMVAEFQALDGPAVFVLSLKAGGTGLNLTAASHVIHLDRWWNPAVEDQATDRAFRIGQHRNVMVHKLVCSGTVEERIDATITAKRELAGKVIGTGETWITELSNNELRDLLTYDASGEDD